MTDTLLPQFPHLRRPPQHVVAGLRQVDPTADLVYMGWAKWLLVSVRPNREVIQQSQRILTNARRLLELWRANPKYRENPGAFRRLIGRYDFAVLATMGARPITEYVIQGEPTSAIVDDMRRMDWLFRHTTDEAFDRALDAPKEQQRAAAHAELTDPARATAAWRWMFTRSHWTGYNPTKPQGPKSGFTRIATI